jgi:hypothetical protein
LNAANYSWFLSLSHICLRPNVGPVLAFTSPDGYGDFIALPITPRPQAEQMLQPASGIAFYKFPVIFPEMVETGQLQCRRAI